MLLVVTFNLKGVTDAAYREGCEQEAPAFASVSGLISKAWIADEMTNTYGGVYTFADRESLETYVGSELFKAIADDPTVESLTWHAFEVLESPSRTTHFGRPAVTA